MIKTDEFVECVGIEEGPTAGVNSRFSLHDSGESIAISFFRVSQRGVVAVFILTASPADCEIRFCFVVLSTAGADILLIFEGDFVLIWATSLFDPVVVGKVPVELDDFSSAPLVALKVDEPLPFPDVSGEGFLGYLSATISTEVVESWLYKFGF